MSLFDKSRDALLNTQESIFADEIFFQDSQGDFTIAFKGIFKSEGVLIDSVTQQEIVSDEPVLWIKNQLPDGVVASEGKLIKLSDKYFKIKDVRNDLDDSGFNLALYEVRDPSMANS